MKVFHIDSSIRQEWSVSKMLSKIFVDELKENFAEAEVDYLDVSKETPKHPSALMIRANYTPPVDRSPEMIAELVESDALVDRMLAADIYVIGLPMYNFSVPSNFKAFIDNIVRIGRTFAVGKDGAEGLLRNKKAYVINTRGADFSSEAMTPMDQLVPYIKVVFGFMGIRDIHFINVHPVEFALEQARANAIEEAKREITEAVNTLNEALLWKSN